MGRDDKQDTVRVGGEDLRQTLKEGIQKRGGTGVTDCMSSVSRLQGPTYLCTGGLEIR